MSASHLHAAESEASMGGAILSALPDFLLAGVCLVTWWRPSTIDPLLVKRLVAIILLEFIVMHSAPFSGIVALSDMRPVRKVAALVALGAIYMLFAWAFSVAFDSPWPMVAFFALMLNRLLPVLLGAVPSGARKAYMASCWIAGGAAYLLTTALAATLPISPLGITPDVIEAQRFTTGGLWTEQPHRPLFMGAMYFAIVGAWEIAAVPLVLRRARHW